MDTNWRCGRALRTWIAAAVLAAPIFAHAQIGIVPAAPKAQETVMLKVDAGVIGSRPTSVPQPGGGIYDTYRVDATQVTMLANKITVSVEMYDSGFPSPPPSQSMDHPLGQFPAGTYQVELVRRLPDGTAAGTVGTASFTVAPRTAAAPLWNNTGLWWNPAESGWGLSVTQSGSSGLIFALWYVYGPNGVATWYAVPDGAWSRPYIYQGPIYRTTGPQFQPCSGGSVETCPPWDPNAVTRTLVGSAQFDFDPTNGNAAFLTTTIDGAKVIRRIERYAF